MNKPARIDAASASEIAPSFKARFTTAEFLRMAQAGAFDDMKIELVQGELERMPPPGTNHAGRQVKVILKLASVFPADQLLGEVGVDLGGDTLLGCDVAVVDRPIDGDRMLDPAEVILIVEVSETSAARDLGMKRLAYARAGIPCYWAVDGERSVVHVYAEPKSGDYAQVSTVRFGEPLAVPGMDASIVID